MLYPQLIDLSNTFLNLVEQETSLLQSHKLNKALGLLVEKEKLANLHAKCVNEFTHSQDWKNCSPEELKDLKMVLGDLRESLIRNEEVLSLTHSLQTNIMNKITKAINKENAPNYRYTKNRKQEENTSPVSISGLVAQI